MNKYEVIGCYIRPLDTCLVQFYSTRFLLFIRTTNIYCFLKAYSKFKIRATNNMRANTTDTNRHLAQNAKKKR